MKKLISLLLSALLALGCAAALAQEEPVDFTPYGFTLDVPDELELSYSPDDSTDDELVYVGGNEEETYFITIVLYRYDDATDIRTWEQGEIDAYVADIAAEEGYSNVSSAVLSGVSFVMGTYTDGEDIYYDALTYLNGYELQISFFGSLEASELQTAAAAVMQTYAPVE